MLELLLGAGVLGTIIAVMEDGDFPGWFSMIICVLAALLPAAIVNAFIPPGLFIVGLAVGAGCAAVAISAFCGMTIKRAAIAASIYLGIRVVLSICFQLMFSLA